MKIYIVLTWLIVCLFHQGLQAQCNFGVADNTSNTYNYAIVSGQSFTANCSGLLQNITFTVSGQVIDELRNSGFFVSARVKNGSGTVLGNATFAGSATQTDQWYSGATIVANFLNANILLQSGSIYTFEVVETSNSIPLYLFKTTSSSVYSGGNYIEDGIQMTNKDLIGWTVNIQAETPPTPSSTFYVSAGGSVTTRGSSVITLSNTKFTNNGTFAGTSGTVQIIGSNSNSNTAIEGTGTTTFNNLTINKSSNNAQLNQNVAVTGNLTLTSGGVMLNSGNINFGSTGSLQNETETNRVFGTGGYLQTTVNLNAPNATNPANLGAIITSTANLGSTIIKRAHSSFTLNGNGINRSFDITPTNNTGLDATLKFNYLDAELNGNSEANLALWKSTNAGTNWTALASTSNATSNFVQSTGIPSFALFSVGANAVVNTPNPPINVATNLTSVCSGSSVSLSGACSSGVLTWYDVSSGGTAIGTNTPLSQSPTANITYYATCKDGVNESARVSTGLITVNALPTATASSNSPICVGTTLNLLGGVQGNNQSLVSTETYAWTGANSFSSTLQNPSISSATTLASGTYQVTVTNANGCTSTATTSVIVNALPTATASSNSPICAGTSLNLLGGVQGNNQSLVSTETYAWTGANSFSSTLQNPSISSASTLASGTYQVTVTNSNGCTASATTSVIVNALPTATASSNSPICVGTTLNLLGGVQGNSQNLVSTETYSWIGVNSFSSTLQNPSILSATSLASGTYQVTVTNANGCTSTATTSVIVNALPTATASSNSPICAGTSLNLLGGVQGNNQSLVSTETYAWTGANSFSSTLQNPSITSAMPLASGTYRVLVTNFFGCTATATTSVIVNALPTATASSNSPICAGTSLNLLGGVQGNNQSLVSTETYAWTGANSFSSTLKNPSISSATTLASGTYQVTVTNANGCTATATTSVIVNALPMAIASSNSPICAGTSLNLLGGVQGNNQSLVSTETYAWTGANSFSSTLKNPSISSATTLASGTYQVTVTNANGCTATATTSVIVNALPMAIASSNSPICAGTSLNLSSDGGVSYTWTGANSFSSTLQNPSISSATTLASGTYQVTVTNSNGCTATATTSVIVNALPTATASSNSPICAGTSLNLLGGVQGNNQSLVSTETYAWTGANSFSSTLQNPSISSATTLASGTYQVTVTNANGCTATATTSVIVNPTPVTPTTQADAQIIFGGGISLTATGCEGTIKWYQKLDDALVGMPVSPTATTQYYAKCEITSNGITCTSEKSNDVTVTVLKPTPPVATGATTCVGTGVTLTATGCSGEVGIFTLKWYQKADSILVSMPVSPTVSTDYFAKCEQTFNGVTAISGKSNFVTLVVLNPSISSVTGATIYKGNSTSLVVTGCTGEGFTVKWYETTTNNMVMMPVSPSITTKYYAKCEQIANNVTCISNKSDDVTITVVNRIFVDITKASLPSQNGTSWAMAYGDLQQGLAQATQGIQNELTEVWVAKGTYKPTATASRNLSFVIPSGVKIYGGFSGMEEELNARNFRTNPTILSGEIGNQQAQNDNSYHVVVFDGSNVNTLLDGFTITGGFANFYTEKSGSGSLISSSLTSTIERGGGIILKSGSKPLIINCTFTNNAATTGGAIYANESAPQIINCKFMGNQGTFGSAIYLESNSNAGIENSLFSGNRGIGTLYNNYSNPILSNCTFGGNGGYNGGIFNSNSQPTVTNSILWGNTTPLNDTQSIISYSIVQGGYAGVGNLNFDPQFVSQTPEGLSPNLSGDYHLKPSSLAIDRGNNGSISLTDLDLDGNLRRFNAGRVDMGAFEFQGNSVSSIVISVSSGNWEINSTWDVGRVPKIGDLVIIDNNHTVNLNGEGAAKNIEYRGNGQLKFNSTNSKLNIGF